MELRSRVLAERYEVEDLLGRGGMAEVYRGRDRTLARTVAIKVLARHLVADPPFVTRFQREAQAAARLSHPNLVSVFDTGSDGDFHYIVMEYVPGRTLAEVLRERGKLPLPRACRIAATVAAALSAAHDAGIVHRDVKPGNVMLTGRGEVKLTDLGIARALGHESLTQTATVLGTAPYFSPEQARGEAVDARSDLYSLGCLLYEMLTRRPPFTGDSALAVAYKHVNEEPIPPSELDPHIPEDVEAVVLRALAKDPDRRYKRAREMREDLEQIVAGPAISPGSKDSTEVMPEPSSTLTIPGPPVPSLPRGPLMSGEPRLARVPRPALAGAAILIVLALVLALSLLGGRSPVPAEGDRAPAPTQTSRPAPPTVANAMASITEVVLEGVQAGEVDQDASDEILKRAQEVQKNYAEGKVEEAFKKLDELRSKVDELVGKGEVAPERVTPIRSAIAELEATIRASPGG